MPHRITRGSRAPPSEQTGPKEAARRLPTLHPDDASCYVDRRRLRAWLGWAAFGRLDERRFRQVRALMIAVSGAMLVV